DRDWRNSFRPRVSRRGLRLCRPGLEEVRRARSSLLSPDRSGLASGRCFKGETGVGLGAEGAFQGTRTHDGGQRFERAKNEEPSMSFWENKRILITGGTGFLGTRVVSELKEKGRITVSAPASREYDFVEQKDVIRVYEDIRPDIVIHM